VAGKVVRTHFLDGERVKSGDILVTLDDTLLNQSILRAKAQLKELEVRTAQALEDAKRLRALFQSGSTSRQELDTKELALATLNAQQTATEAALRQLEIEQEKSRIRAPFDGIVLKRQVERGEWVTVGTSVMTVANPRSVEIALSLPQRLRPFVAVENGLEGEIDGSRYHFTIERIVPDADLLSRTMPVYLSVDAPGLFAGQKVTVMVPTDLPKNVVMVPRDAVITKLGRTVIYRVEEAVARSVPVTVVGYQGERAGVSAEGLEKGAVVVIKGHERLRDGQPVMVEP